MLLGDFVTRAVCARLWVKASRFNMIDIVLTEILFMLIFFFAN